MWAHIIQIWLEINKDMAAVINQDMAAVINQDMAAVINQGHQQFVYIASLDKHWRYSL